MQRLEVHQAQLTLLLAAVVGCVQVPDPSLSLTNERTSIERTYELTKYLEHQLKEIKDTYLSYLGPPFSDPDFSPPRPNSSSLSVPSAATRVELWRGLEAGARLAQNQRAYSVLLSAVRELARSSLCPYLQSSLLHFCSGLHGLLGSIAGLMSMLGHDGPPLPGDRPPPHRPGPAAERGPAPLRAHARRGRDEPGEEQAGREAERKRERERERAERGRKGRKREGEGWEGEEEELAREGGMERWGRRRRLLSIEEEEENKHHHHNNNNNNNNNKHALSPASDRERERGMSREEEADGVRESVPLLFSSPSHRPGRSSRSLSSLYSSTPHPPLSPFSLLYRYGGGAADGHTLLATPLLSARPASNDFSRKVEGFWVLRELQSWLWRSAKDFNRLKKRLRA